MRPASSLYCNGGRKAGEILAVVGTGHHAHTASNMVLSRSSNGCGLAHGHVPVVWFQIIHRRGGDGLLGKHVQGGAWNGQCFDVSGAHAFDACGRADDLLSCNRVEQCMRDSPDLVVGAPHRCNPEDTDNGGAIWMTRSTEPMSMPSSRLDVATTQRNWPRLSCSSICLRRSLETEP